MEQPTQQSPIDSATELLRSRYLEIIFREFEKISEYISDPNEGRRDFLGLETLEESFAKFLFEAKAEDLPQIIEGLTKLLDKASSMKSTIETHVTIIQLTNLLNIVNEAQNLLQSEEPEVLDQNEYKERVSKLCSNLRKRYSSIVQRGAQDNPDLVVESTSLLVQAILEGDVNKVKYYANQLHDPCFKIRHTGDVSSRTVEKEQLTKNQGIAMDLRNRINSGDFLQVPVSELSKVWP